MTDEQDNVIRVDFGNRRVVDDAAEAIPPEEQTIPVPTTAASKEKLQLFERMIEKGTVMVTIDARAEGVAAPPNFFDEFRLNLNFCHMFGIPDFAFDADGVRASLSFGGVDQFINIPWSAVYMLRSHQENDVVLFPSDFPEEMTAMLPPLDDV